MTTIKQVSVMLANQSGKLAGLTQLLADNNFNIRALCLADTADFGILRLIVNNPEEAAELLGQNGYLVNNTDVLAVEMPDRPGGLNEVMQVLDNSGINIEYSYAFVQKSAKAALVVLQSSKLEEAEQVLRANGINMISENYLATL